GIEPPGRIGRRSAGEVDGDPAAAAIIAHGIVGTVADAPAAPVHEVPGCRAGGGARADFSVVAFAEENRITRTVRDVRDLDLAILVEDAVSRFLGERTRIITPIVGPRPGIARVRG